MISALLARLGAGSPYRVVTLRGPAGAGKTTAIGSALAGMPDAHHVRVAIDGGSFAGIARTLADALSPSSPAIARGFAGRVATVRHGRDAARTFGAWFARALGSQRRIVALDDLHLLDDGDALTMLVATIDAADPCVRWILAGRSFDAWPLPWWLARSYAAVPFEMPAPGDARDDEAIVASTAAWLARAEGPDADLAIALALLPALEPRLVAGIAGARSMLDRLEREIPFAFAAGGMRAACSRTFLAATNPRAIELAARPLRFADPAALLRLYTAVDDRIQIVRTLDRRGFELLDGGRADIVERAVACLGPAERRACPIALLQEAKRETALGRHDVAEAWFLLAADNAADAETEARIRLTFASDLLRRARTDAVDVLESLARASVSEPIDATVAATLAAAYAQADRVSQALETIAPALAWARQRADADATRALIFRQAAYVYLRAADPETASKFASAAIELANACCLDDIVASGLSVLVAVASQHDDDSEALLGHLADLENCAIRLENEFLVRYALLAQVDARCELGEWAEVDRLEARLGTLELENDALHVDETLVRVRALRAAANGNFASALAILRGPNHFATDPEMRALRQAEIAVLAAAAGDRDSFPFACAEADAALGQSHAAASAICVRAVLTTALASTVAGDHRDAAERVRMVETAAAAFPRLDALRELVACTIRFAQTPGGREANAFVEALSTLGARGLGGVAALVAALPATQAEAVS